MTEPAAPAPEGPHLADILASSGYRRLLVLSIVIGLVVSVAAFVFLVVVHELEDVFWEEIPEAFGFDEVPAWWAMPLLLLAGVLTGLAITRLPGRGGHIAANGIGGGPTEPSHLPGILLAALASLTLGASLGPEAPLIALGGGLGLLALRRATRRTPASAPEAQQQQAEAVMSVAGITAAVAAIFGSPIVAAVLVLEMLGLAGARLVILIVPALLASGIGGLVFTGVGDWTGLAIPALSGLPLETFERADLGDVVGAFLIPAAVALGLIPVNRAARLLVPFAIARPVTAAVGAGFVVGSAATLFALTTDRAPTYVALSGQEAIAPLVSTAATWSVASLVILLFTKAIAYAVSLAAFRGGAIFPSLLIGTAVGVLAAPLPGLGLDAGVAIGVSAAAGCMMRDLPLSAAVLTLILCISAGIAVIPLIVISVAVATVVTEVVDRRDAPMTPVQPAAGLSS